MVNERRANDTLRYLQGLFDVDKFIQEHPRKNTADGSGTQRTREEIPNAAVYDHLKGIIDNVVQQSKYNKVDLNQLFSFMNQ